MEVTALISFLEYLDEPSAAFPDIEADAVLIIAIRREAERRGKVLAADISKFAAAARAEEALEHEAVHRCAEFFRNHRTAFVIPCAIQRILAVVAVIFGGDFHRRALAALAEGDFLREDGVAARNGRYRKGVSAIGDAGDRKDVVCEHRRLSDRAVGEHDGEVFCRGRDRSVDLGRDGQIAAVRKDRLDLIAALRRGKGIGIDAVLALFADDFHAVHLEGAEHMRLIGRKRECDVFADIGRRHLHRAARHVFHAMDRNGDLDVGAAESDLTLNDRRPAREPVVEHTQQLDLFDLAVLIFGHLPRAERDPVGLTRHRIHGEVALRIYANVHRDAVLCFDIVDERGVAGKAELVALRRVFLFFFKYLDEPVSAVPNIEADAVLIAALRCKAERRCVVQTADVVEISAAADAEEAFEHEAVHRCAEFFQKHRTAFVIPCAVQCILAVVAIVVGRDRDRSARGACGKAHFLREHDVVARLGIHRKGISAVSDARECPDAAAVRRCLSDGVVGEHHLQIARDSTQRPVYRSRDIHIAAVRKDRLNLVAALRRGKGIGVDAVLALFADHFHAVHHERTVDVRIIGRKGERDLFADIGRRCLHRTARHVFHAMDRNGDLDVGAAESDLTLNDRRPAREPVVEHTQQLDLFDLAVLIFGHLPRAERDPVGLTRHRIHGEVALRIYANVHRDAVLCFDIVDERGVAGKAELVALRRVFLSFFEHLDEPVLTIPNVEADAVLIAALRRKAERRCIVQGTDLGKPADAADAEEAFEHIPVGHADGFGDRNAVLRIVLAPEFVLAVCAVVIRRDIERKALPALFEHDVALEYGIAALFRRDLDGICAVGKARGRVDSPLSRRFQRDGAVGNDDGQIVRNAAERGVDRRIQRERCGDPYERRLKGIVLRGRTEGVGVCTVCSLLAVDRLSVHLEGNDIVRFGRHRYGDVIAEHRVCGNVHLAARELHAALLRGFAVEREGYGDIHPPGAHFEGAVFENGDVRAVSVVLLGEPDRFDGQIDGKADGGICFEQHPLGVAAADIGGDIALAVDREGEVHAAVFLEVGNGLRVGLEVILGVLILEHEVIAPLGKAEARLRVRHLIAHKVHGVGEVDKIVVVCPLVAEEAAEHEAAFKRADLAVDLRVAARGPADPLERDGIHFKHDLRVRLGGDEHVVEEALVVGVAHGDLVHPRRKPFERDAAVCVRRTRDHGIAALEGDDGICKGIVGACAVDGGGERLHARRERFKHRLHAEIARDVPLRDPHVRLLHILFRLDARRRIHIKMDLIARDGDAVHAEFFERIPFIRLDDEGDRAVRGSRIVTHPLLHDAVLRLCDINVVGNDAFFVEVIPALRISPAIVEAGAEHIVLSVGLTGARIVVCRDDARCDDEVAAILHALCRAFAANFVKIAPRDEELKGVLGAVGILIGAGTVACEPDIGHILLVDGAEGRHPCIALRLGDGERAVCVDREAADRLVARHRDGRGNADVQLHAAVAVRPARGIDIAHLSLLFLIGIGEIQAVFAVIGAHFDLRRALRFFLNEVVVVVDALPVARIVRTENGPFQPFDAAVNCLVEHTVDLEPLIRLGKLAVRASVLECVFGRRFAFAGVIAARRKRARRRRTQRESQKDDRSLSLFHKYPLTFREYGSRRSPQASAPPASPP